MYHVTVKISLTSYFCYKRSYFFNDMNDLKKFMAVRRPHYVIINIDEVKTTTADEILPEFDLALSIADKMYAEHLIKCSTHYDLSDKARNEEQI